MKSGIKLSLAIALVLGSAPALALQLGEIRVKSALDQPLVAEIPIQLDKLSEATNLRAGLASQADFDKAGLPRTGLDRLRFSIVTDSTGHKLVLITSQQPINDPYLDFLIEVDTSTGKQLREYTLLLDPVIGAPPTEQEIAANALAQQQQPAPPPPPPQVPAPVQPAAHPAAPTPAPRPAPVQRAVPPAPASAPAKLVSAPSAAPAQPAAHAGEYTVQRGDTLYRIASENRPDDQVSVNQMMLALQSNNPDAFYRDNINNLKSGAILRIPTRDEISSAPSGSRARALVHRQIEDWRGIAARKATVVGNEVASGQGAHANAAAGTGDKLALVPPAQGGGSASTRPGEKGGTGSEEIAGLKQQLATAKESLVSAKQENSELQSRVKQLEDISGKNQKLLGMKDAQIAELQGKLAQLQKGSAAAAPSASTRSPATAGTVAQASTASASPSTTATTNGSAATPATAGSANGPQQASTPKSAPASATSKSPAAAADHAAPQTEALPWYQRPVTWIVAGVALLVLILLGLLRRRPKPLPEPEPAEPEPDEQTGASSLADHFGDSPLPHDDHAGESDVEAEPHDDVAHDAGREGAPAAQAYDFTFDEPPPAETVAEQDDVTRERSVVGPDSSASSADVAEVHTDATTDEAVADEAAPDEFSDDPVDTKLDLARAYLDMGDPAGARAMLEEVVNEGSQSQKDEAQRLLDGLG